MVGTWTFALKLTCTLKNPRNMWVPHSPTLLYAFFLSFLSASVHTRTQEFVSCVLGWYPLSSPVACRTHVWGVVYVILHLLSSTLGCSIDLMSFYTLFFIFCWVTDWLMSFPSYVFGSDMLILVWGALHTYLAYIK